MQLMEYMLIVGLGLALVSLYAYWSPALNAPEKIVEEDKGVLILRTAPVSRLLGLFEKKVESANIVRVQQSNYGVTLFTQSDNAFDIFLPKRYVGPLLKHLESVLVKYDLIKVG
ncbi:hypothetical protein DRW07_16350 [Alteromonas sediminis]|uniref:Uncharacterized protein n=1 Tax=Alteromonas sediminis TaxID=2259342 RepID=A0A3N5XZG4_9ALTE|nr:hypothetical protein [Alteromonas sediminis]RPJ65466.1 hypothetical protein DRW07_16350 [Alteromonas sediminis]